MLLVLSQFCEVNGPSTLFCTQRVPLGSGGEVPPLRRGSTGQNISKDTVKEEETEPAKQGFITKVKGFGYVSTRSVQAPFSSVIRSVTLRSLSHEYVGPGREGPVIFGDHESGLTMAYLFKIKDSAARGFMRWYAIIFMLPDHSQLVATCDLVQRYIKAIVRDFQSRSESVFSDEIAEKEHQSGGLNADKAVYPGMSIGSFRRVRKPTPLRTLDQLMGNRDLFRHLHVNFCWVLHHCGAKYVEYDFPETTSLFESVRDFDAGDNGRSTPMLNSSNGSTSGGQVSFEENDGLEKPVRATRLFDTLGQLAVALGASSMRTLLYHTICGNQIVVRGGDNHLVNSIFSLIHLVRPSLSEGTGSDNVQHLSQYCEPHECRLLALREDTPVPDPLARENFALLDIICDGRSSSVSGKLPPRNSRHDFLCRSAGISRPTWLGRALEKIVCRNPAHGAVMENLLMKATMEEWLNKVKSFGPFSDDVQTSNFTVKNFLQIMRLEEDDIPALYAWHFSLDSMRQPQPESQPGTSRSERCPSFSLDSMQE